MFKMFGTGNLVKDPEEITTASGLTVCRMTIASNERYTKEDGTRPTQYFTVIAWRKLAENCLKYLKKVARLVLWVIHKIEVMRLVTAQKNMHLNSLQKILNF